MSNKKIILFLLVSISSIFALAQPAFEKVYGGNAYDYGYSVRQTFDKGYIVAGATTSFGNGNTDAYLLKVDSMGVGEWHKTFGDLNIEQTYSVIQTVDSGYVLAGYTNSYGAGGYDVYVIKTDKFGNTIWTRAYGGSGWDFGLSIDETYDNAYIIAGGTYSYGSGNEDMYLLKITTWGDTVWTKTYGGANDEEAKSVIQTPDGGYLLTGFSKSFGDPLGDIFTVKTDNMGDTLWTQIFSGYMEDWGSQVVNKASGDFMLAGSTRRFSDGTFAGIRFDINATTGNMYGIDSAYGGSADDDYMCGLHFRADGRAAFLGTTFSYGFGLGTSDYKIDIWNPYDGYHGPTFGQTEMETAYSLDHTIDGGYIICGVSNSFTPLDHIYLVKVDSNGVSSGSTSVFLTGINENESSHNGTLFPNPANESITIDLSSFDSDDLVISVMNIVGQEVYTERVLKISSTHKMSIMNLPNGVYFCRVQNKVGGFSKKFIVQH